MKSLPALASQAISSKEFSRRANCRGKLKNISQLLHMNHLRISKDVHCATLVIFTLKDYLLILSQKKREIKWSSKNATHSTQSNSAGQIFVTVSALQFPWSQMEMHWFSLAGLGTASSFVLFILSTSPWNIASLASI